MTVPPTHPATPVFSGPGGISPAVLSAINPRGLPAAMAERLIAALDVPTIAAAREMVNRLDG